MNRFAELFIIILLATGCFLAACNDEESDAKDYTIHVVSSTGVTAVSANGAFEPFEVIHFDLPALKVFHQDNRLYTVHYTFHDEAAYRLQVTDLISKKTIISPGYVKDIDSYLPRSFAGYNNRLYITDRTSSGSKHSVLIYDALTLLALDTLEIGTGSDWMIQSLIAIDNRLFINTGSDIQVIDLATYKTIGQITLPQPVIDKQFVRDHDSNIYLARNYIFKIETQTLSLTSITDKPVGWGYLNVVYNPDDHALYNLFPYAQPAPRTLGMDKFDLNTNKRVGIVDNFKPFLEDQAQALFINYHAASKQIVIGEERQNGASVIELYSTDGVFKTKFEIPGAAITIF